MAADIKPKIDIGDEADDRPSGRADVSEALIASARRMLDDTPPNGISIRAIAADATVNHGLVHRHFGSKVALFRAVLEELISEIALGIDPNADLVDDLMDIVNAVAHTSAIGQVLAWTLAEGVPPEEFGPSYRLIRRARDRLRERGIADPDGVVVFLAAAAFGWSAFEPLFAYGLTSATSEQQQLHTSLSNAMRRFLVMELGTTHQGASGMWVRSSMISLALVYSSQRRRDSKSIGLNFHCLSGS